MTANQFFITLIAIIGLACFIVGTPLLFFGGLVLMSVKCTLVGGALMFCGIALLVSFDL